MNKIILIGTIVKDVELKTVNSAYMTNLTIAVRRDNVPYNSKKQDTDFIRCTAWGKTAEVIAKHFSKGHKIALEGSLRIEVVKKGESTNYYTSVNVNSIDFAETKTQMAQTARRKQEETFMPKPIERLDDDDFHIINEDDEVPF